MEEDTVAEDARPKLKRTKMTKINATDQPTHNNLASGTDPQSPAAGQAQGNKNNKSLKPELKVPSGKPLVDLALGDPAVQPIKTKTKKRKVADLDVEDEPPPQKRKARSRSRSKTQTTETVTEVALKKKLAQNFLGTNTTSLAIADAINHASGKLAVDRHYDKFVSPVGVPGAECTPRPKEVSDSQIKHTCPQPQAEIDDDPPLPQCAGKKNRTAPAKAPKIILQPQPDCMPSTEKSAKPTEEDGQDQRKLR